MGYADNIRDARDIRAQVSAARSLREGLEDLILAGGDRAARRWCWELLQNARDVGGPGGVRVRFELTNEPEPTLTFLHDGPPFTSDDLVGLVEKDSTKRGPAPDGRPDPLGHFGTGFLTTHLLARRAEVHGFVHDPGEPVKAFALPLDRTGDDEPTLQRGVEATFAALDGIDQALPATSFVPGALNTRFTYRLDARGLEVARTGFEDLGHLLPLTLALVDGITSVEVAHTETTYFVRSRPDVAENVRLVAVHVEGPRGVTVHEYVVVQEGRTSLAVPARTDGAFVSLLPLAPGTPRLFCGFPLVGTEAFPFPVVVNSPGFYPTEKRDGVALSDANHAKPRENKRRFEDEVLPLFERLLSAAANWGGAYVLAGLGSGKPFDLLDAAWYEDRVLTPLRAKALLAPLVDTDDGRRAPITDAGQSRLVRFPAGEDPDVQGALWDVACPLFSGSLPAREDLWAWGERVWTDRYDLHPAHLVLKAAHGTLAALANALGSDESGALAWLNELVGFLRRNGYGHYLDPFKATVWGSAPNSDVLLKQNWEVYKQPLLPNQHGRFCHAKDLWVDRGLDEALKDVAASLGLDVRATLLHAEVNLKDEAHKALTAEDLAVKVEKLVYKRVHDSDAGPSTREAFAALLRWFDENPAEAERLFGRLYSEQHLLQTAEEARALRLRADLVGDLEHERDHLADANAALLAEVDALRAKISTLPVPGPAPKVDDEAALMASHYAETWIEIKRALGALGTAEAAITAKDLQHLLETHPEQFKHVSKASQEAYVTFRAMLERAKTRVRAALDANPLYETSGWTEVPDMPTIIEGVRRRGVRAEAWHPPHPVTLVIRPSDGGIVILYDPLELAVLTNSDTELWIEGDGPEPERLTLGGFATRLGVNRLPLRVPVGKPAVLHLS